MTQTYRVYFTEVQGYHMDVAADSKDGAEKSAIDLIDCGVLPKKDGSFNQGFEIVDVEKLVSK